MDYARFPIEGVKKIYAHSLANTVFTPAFGQLYEGKYRKDGRDIDVNLEYCPTADDVDIRKIPPQFFLVKDSGAYLMAATEATLPGEKSANFVVYCDGCNPDLDADYYERARRLFGGDDFAEALPLEWLNRAIDNASALNTPWMVVSVTNKSLRLVTGQATRS